MYTTKEQGGYISCTQVYLKQLWIPSGFILLPCSVDLLVKCHGERHTKQLEKQNNFYLGSVRVRERMQGSEI